jgi:hypothetical protein
VRRTVSAPEPEQAPPIDWETYEKFARDALEALSAGDREDAVLLRQQLSDAMFDEMDYTGAGFFLSVSVPPDAPRLGRSGVIGDVHAQAIGHQGPLGLMLFVKDGVATELEAFAYADWPDDLSRFSLQYVRWEPNAGGNGATAVNVGCRDPDSMWSD